MVDISIDIELTKEKWMRCYEHTLIVRPDISESQKDKLLEKYQEIINQNSGKVVKAENWGLLNFTKEIKNNRKGYYFHFKFEGDGKIVKKLEEKERIDDFLLRFLTVKVKKFDLENLFFSEKEKI